MGHVPSLCVLCNTCYSLTDNNNKGLKVWDQRCVCVCVCVRACVRVCLQSSFSDHPCDIQ